MVDRLKVKARIERGDGSVAPHTVSAEDVTRGDPEHMGAEIPVEPHDRTTEVATQIDNKKLICPQCGKLTLHVEFPDHYEAWTKCSECRFFMGMSNEEWHRMENSQNLNEKIKKMALEKELVKPWP